ncbi:carboxymuconolactone decarboxylase family protein [Salinicola sp. MIT1003]|uniref:carboxymuconolactone decarboxylase family protein n=1 Tax=Salinicola sp. MIT1003 TaxID=1882734 RepID=UPI0009F36942|nr:carboxymuconolactone decarboxylase family protein [Salinicola sp. MIT1003]
MTRLSPPDQASLDQEQRRIYEAIMSSPRGRVGGPLALWLHRPELADRAQALGRYCRYETLLSARLSELVILVTARVWGAEYEWQAHEPKAREAGLPDAVIEAIRVNIEPDFEHHDEYVVYHFSREMQLKRRVDDRLYHEAVDVLGDMAVVDLVGVLGYYGLISMTINAFDVAPLDPDALQLSRPDTGVS